MKYTKALFALLITLALLTNAQAMNKEEGIEHFRQHFSKTAYRGNQLSKEKVEKISAEKALSLLGKDGRFTDLIENQEKIESEHLGQQKDKHSHLYISEMNEIAYNRMWRIAKKFRGKDYKDYDKKSSKKLYKAIVNYGKIELNRKNVSSGRFHESCFAIPTAAVNIYFCLYSAMDASEKDQLSTELLSEANEIIKQVGFQSWTQPFRNDFTDDDVVNIERFRKHVWWVGGNALAYRSLLPAAAAMSSIEMMDVLSQVAKRGISDVSQNTYDDAFWTEGFTADGAGWGHGKQCLIWGYPIDGTMSALTILGYFSGTPWADKLEKENIDAIINYLQGSSWHYYKGFVPPNLGRHSMVYVAPEESEKPKYLPMLKSLLTDWEASLTETQKKELQQLMAEAEAKDIQMKEKENGYYTGTRWFFNNDNLIKKNKHSYTMISMASVRCDGIESYHDKADAYNYYTCDGATLFMKDGNEYHQAIGAWNLTAYPGVTSRQGEENLKPLTNWRGYCSTANFAAAATSGNENAAAGYIFDKMNASAKKGTNDTQGLKNDNAFLYGVEANKAYFMLDDYMIALGCGITNKNPEVEGEIWTTIDQTLWRGNLSWSNGTAQNSTTKATSTTLIGDEIVWAAQQGGFAYAVFPQYTQGSIELSSAKRATRWNKLNIENKKKKDLPQEMGIFQLHINHGTQVKNGNYAYAVYSGDLAPADAFKELPLDILQNTTDIQAVSWNKKAIVGAIFYTKNGSLNTKEWTLSTSAPCAILLEKDEKGYLLSITDAEMNAALKSIEVSSNINGTQQTLTVKMPQGKHCGQSVTVKW